MADKSLSYQAGRQMARMSWSSRIGASLTAVAIVVLLGVGLMAWLGSPARTAPTQQGQTIAPTASAQQSAAEKEAQYQAARETRLRAIQQECTTGIDEVVKASRAQSASGDLNMAAATLNQCTDISKDATFLREVKSVEKARAAKLAKLEREEKARKKKEGVRIGMSKEDVLSSSWGKPQHINTTTTARGSREQWVYGGRNYLYFEGDTLSAIQN